MIRNDYRRALIMLRGLIGGQSGHVRLERRTLNGTMQFTVNGVNGDSPLYGVLLGEQNGAWFAQVLGQLTQDRRDQAALLYSFDPRNLGGRDLEDYQLVGVMQQADAPNALVLSGYLMGSREVNWDRVHQLCAGLVSDQQPALTEANAVQESVITLPEEIACEPAEPTFAPLPSAEEPVSDASPQLQSVGFSAGDTASIEGSALSAMPSPDAAWPESILALRSLFEMNPPIDPFPAPGYVFVQAPLPSEEGESHCAIGLKTELEEYTVLCYAVPGSFALEPPPGLEGYSWRGTGSDGWWTTCIDLSTGEPYEGDDP